MDKDKKENEISIQDQNKINALASLDEAKLSWFHIKAILISGCGFFTDSYDIFIINLVMPM